MLGNICEGTGYLWVGFLTVLIGAGMDRRADRAVYLAVFGVFVVLAAWMVLPVPQRLGSVLALDLVPPNRVLPALGLANALLLGLFLARHDAERVMPGRLGAIGAGGFFTLLLVLLVVNQSLGTMFPLRQVIAASAYTAAILVFLAAGWFAATAIALVLPLALASGLVNPIDRGLAPITRSGITEMLVRRPSLRRARYLVFSSSVVGPDYVAAHGLDVLNTFRWVPDLEKLGIFDDASRFAAVYNSTGYLRAIPLPPGEAPRFAPESPGVVSLSVSPLDPRIRAAGITVLVFDQRPPEDWIRGLEPIADASVDGLWLYAVGAAERGS